MTEPDEHTPIDAALELAVYAPLGFALEARNLLPRFVERGRNQVALARVVGKFAVRKGVEDLEAQLVDRQAQALDLLRGLGLIPADGDGTPRSGDDVPDAPVAPVPGTAATTTSTPTPPVARPADGEPPATAAAASQGPVGGVDAESLAIHDYDSLSASQVVPRLASLTDDELESVRRYEAAGRGRKTILSKIAQLQAA